MTLNLIVPAGEIKFVMYDDRLESKTRTNFYEVRLSPKNYKRLTVEPGIWMAFQGIDRYLNILLNIANIEHDPLEGESIGINDIKYNWEL